MSKQVKMTVSQAIIRFLQKQYVSRDSVEYPFFAGMWGIFGHGNVAGLGEALQQSDFPYFLSRNEQAMTHTSIAYAKAMNRMRAFACTASVGPGSTNMVTGAATATINRIPLLLFPSDIFTRRNVAPVLQQLEQPYSQDITVNDAFKPVSRYWDRIHRPDQLPWTLLEAMRILTSPDETGTATICLPQDLQTEFGEYPESLFEKRVWSIPRIRPDEAIYRRLVESIKMARKPFIIAGGGVLYSGAHEALAALASIYQIPAGETQAGKGSLPWDHSMNLGSVGVTGSLASNEAARSADLVICIGTRLSDFTSASKSLFQHPEVRFVHINVCSMDAHKLSALPIQGDAKVVLESLVQDLKGYMPNPQWVEATERLRRTWLEEADKITSADIIDGLLQQPAVLKTVNEAAGTRSTVVCAAGSLPADLHKLWKTAEPGGYHMEYGYSCMGYEIAGGLGVKMACPDRHVVVMVGDGSYQMLSSELITSVQEGINITVVVLNNHGFGSIGALSASVGSAGFGTNYRFGSRSINNENNRHLPYDIAMNARSYGIKVVTATTLDELKKAMDAASSSEHTHVIVVDVDKQQRVPSYGWWDVPVAEISENEDVAESRLSYNVARKEQRHYY